MPAKYTEAEIERIITENNQLKMELERFKNETPFENQPSGPGMSIIGLNERIIQVDSSNQIIYLNSSMLELLGKKKGDYIGKDISEIDNLPWGHGLLQKLLDKARKDGMITEERNFTNPKDNQENFFQFQVSISPKSPNTAHFVIQDITKQKNVEDAFKRMVSPAIMQRVLEMGKDFSKAEKYEMTVMFADLRGFTTFSESMDANSVRDIANEFLSVASEIVLRYHGTVDKYIGDEIMAIFGAPFYFEDHYIKALNTSITLQLEHHKLMDNWKQRNKPAIPLGIGINSGEVVVGLVGSVMRMDYTVLGHPVNLAARLCSLAPPDQIWLGPRTFELIKNRVTKMGELAGVEGDIKFKPAGQIKVRGITELVNIISVNMFE